MCGVDPGRRARVHPAEGGIREPLFTKCFLALLGSGVQRMVRFPELVSCRVRPFSVYNFACWRARLRRPVVAQSLRRWPLSQNLEEMERSPEDKPPPRPGPLRRERSAKLSAGSGNAGSGRLVGGIHRRGVSIVALAARHASRTTRCAALSKAGRLHGA